METPMVHWGPAWWALGLGVGLGLLWIWEQSVRALAANDEQKTDFDKAGAENDARELEALLGALRELHERQGRIEKEAYAQEKAQLEAQAVAVMQRQHASRTARAPSASRATPRAMSPLVAFGTNHPRFRQAMWAIACVGVAWVLGDNLQKNATPSASGAAPVASVGEGVSAEELQALRERLAQAPNDVDALLRVAHLALRAQQFDEAIAFNDRALALAPNSLEGLTHRAVLAAKDGDTPAAMQGLQRVVKSDPGFAEAWFFQGMLGMQSGDLDAMRSAFAQFLLVAPDGPQKERVRAMLERSKT